MRGDQLRPRVDGDESVVVPVVIGVDLRAPCFLAADEGPHLVELQHVAVQVPHDALEEPAAPLPDGHQQVRDGLPGHPGHALCGAQGAAVHEGGHHLRALPFRENVHRDCLSPADDARSPRVATTSRYRAAQPAGAAALPRVTSTVWGTY
jgi:hypothetical protein